MATATGRIFKQADRQGGDACVHGTRIPVWVLDNCRRLGMPDAKILSTYPSLIPPTWKPPGNTSQPTGKRSSRPSATTKRAATAPWSNGGCCSTRTCIDEKLASLTPGRWCYRVNRRP